jgi:OCT family organic cation transporter-like MFS transporter 4/5
VVAGIAYLIPDWHQMQLVLSLPLLILLGTYWVLPESPRYIHVLASEKKTL